jgi:hypothetical protein
MCAPSIRELQNTSSAPEKSYHLWAAKLDKTSPTRLINLNLISRIRSMLQPGKNWRTVLAISLLLLSAVACAAPAAPRPAEAPTLPPSNPKFSAILATQDLAVGTNRVAFGLLDLNGMPVRTEEAQVQAVYFPPGQQEGKVRHTANARFQQWPPPGDRGVYITTLSFDVAGEASSPQDGQWVLQITTTADDGTPIEAQTTAIVKEESATPGIGEPAPASETPTAQEVDDLSTITSADTPDPELYQLSIREALETGKPTVVVFATPAFCVSATCGPQVEMLSQVKERHKGEANFIHVEVFQDPHLIQGGRPDTGLAPAVKEWGLPSEPWTFVIDKEGRVHAKFEQFTPSEEIEAALLEVL